MKNIFLSLLLIIPALASFGQAGSQSLSGVFYRVQDTVTYQAQAATKHANGYKDIYYNDQATTKHWDIWNGSSYDHIFDFASGGGGPVTGEPLTVTDDAVVGLSYTGAAEPLLDSGNITIDWIGTTPVNRGGTGATTLTPGAVLIMGNSSAVDESPSLLFWDWTDSQLGIGTNAPAGWLHIAAGTTTANTQPIKVTAGSLPTTKEAGTIGYDNNWYSTGSNLYALGANGQIATQTANVQNTSASETDAFTVTTLASTLTQTGDILEMEATGQIVVSTSTLRLRAYFAGTSIGDTGALTLSTTGFYKVRIRVIRTGASTARAAVEITTPTGTPINYINETDLTSLTFTNTNILKYTFQSNVNTGDFISKMGTVKFNPASK